MATDRPPAAIGRTVNHPLPTVPAPTAPVTSRTGVTSTKAAAAVPPPHPAVFAPWTQLLAKAEARYKAEISQALAELQRATTDAGRLLDQSQAMAAEAAGQLERAGWDAWARYMKAADDTRTEILGRAVTSYEQAITYATGQYDHALTSAEKTYKTIADDANRAQADVKALAS